MASETPRQDGSCAPSPQDLWMLLATIAAARDPTECARLTATGAPSLVSCDFSCVGLATDDDRDRWVFAAQREGRLLPASELDQVSAALHTVGMQAGQQGGLRRIRGGEQALQQIGLQSGLIAPLLTVRGTAGVLLVGSRDDDGFSSRDELTLRTIGQQLATSVENLRLRAALERHATELEGIVDERTAQLRRAVARQRALLRINNAIVATLDRASLFGALARELAQVTQFDRASLTLYNPEDDTLRVSSLSVGDSKKHGVPEGAVFKRAGSHLQSALDGKRTLVRMDMQEGRRTPQEDALLADGLRSYVVAPLIAKRGVIGTLNVASAAPARYDDEDADFLLEVASQVALAIENMIAYEEISDLKSRLEEENLCLREEVDAEAPPRDILGQSAPIRRVLSEIAQVASTDATVLVTGETGTGKELVARAIHDASERSARAMVSVNCAALPAGLIESELFGHEKGAFTGASARRTGRFELADQGTIFLDEVGDLPLELQAKLLRVLQDGAFERVGGVEQIAVDARLVAATNCDLPAAVEAGEFRADLYYRLNVFPIGLPPLRDRREDIPELVRHFVQRSSARLGRAIERIPKRVMDALEAYPWPGNVRELQNVIERAVILSRGTALELGDWIPRPGEAVGEARLQSLRDVERSHILEALRSAGWRVSGKNGAAEILGLKPTTLEARMKRLGITRPQ